MDRHARESLQRAAECARLADAESDPELKAYLITLASSWMKVATADTDQHDLEARSKDSQRRQSLLMKSAGLEISSQPFAVERCSLTPKCPFAAYASGELSQKTEVAHFVDMGRQRRS